MKHNLLFSLLLILSIYLMPSSELKAANEELDFTLINSTGVNIASVYIAPHDSEDWGDDVMKNDILRDGETVEIRFHPKDDATIWDLRIEDKDGESVEWESLDLSKISKLKLKIVKGKAIAEHE